MNTRSAKDIYFEALSGVKLSRESEKVIAEDSHYSYLYAVNIIKKRFILGETAISQDSYICWSYSAFVVKGKLPEFMHNTMICYGIKNPDNYWVKKYMEYLTTEFPCE